MLGLEAVGLGADDPVNTGLVELVSELGVGFGVNV